MVIKCPDGSEYFLDTLNRNCLLTRLDVLDKNVKLEFALIVDESCRVSKFFQYSYLNKYTLGTL